MKRIQDFYEDLPEPVEAQARFEGGPFDGKVTTLTLKKELDTSITINMKDRSVYRFKEPYVFVFEGYLPPPGKPPKPTLKQRLVTWLLS